LMIAIIGLNSFVVKKESQTITEKNTTSYHSVRVASSVDDKKMELYQSIVSRGFSRPHFGSFSMAIDGYTLLKNKGVVQNTILTIVDFDLPSTQKRLWVIDMKTMEILYHSLVAHGKNSGDVNASNFSNENESYKSSLGFYLTNETYIGTHGLSLKLDGLEINKNNNARDRAIVIHGAEYVSNQFIKTHQRLGRSFGCPALPLELTSEIVNSIKNKSCFYIHHRTNTVTNIAI
jgi:hypothetical protein